MLKTSGRFSWIYWGRTMALLVVLLPALGCFSAGQDDPTIKLFRPGTLPVGLDLHGSAVVGKRFYVFGGKKASVWNKEAWSAEILPNMTLGPWRPEAPLPEFRTHIADLVQVADYRIYIVGGLLPLEENILTQKIRVSKDILWTEMGADGMLGQWQRAGGINLRHGATVATDTGIYAFGGLSGTSVTDVIRYSPFSADGVPGDVRDAGKLPTPLYYQGAAYMEGRLYVWGGRKSTSTTDMSDAVYASTLYGDGTVGDWTMESRVPTPVCRAGFLGFKDFIVSVGGQSSGAKAYDRICYARLGKNGKLGPWTAVNSDMESRMYHSVAVDKERNAVFISGGRVADEKDKQMHGRNVITTIQAFALPK
jgi:hypothetical protein